MANDLESIRARANLAAPDLAKVFYKESEIRPVRASARDVPALLELLDALRPVIVAACEYVHSEGADGDVDMLVQAVDRIPYDSLRMLEAGVE